MTFLMVKNVVFKLIRKISSSSMVMIFQFDRNIENIYQSKKKKKNYSKLAKWLLSTFLYNVKSSRRL